MMIMPSRFFCLLFVLAGCAKPVALPPPVALDPARTGVSEPARIPPLDDRAYRIVKLDNGLTAFLVSDPDAVESAAALSVGVGSHAEPEDRAGLAHFLEHMLFMGTEMYPDVDGFDAHIAVHAGFNNAWTGDAITQYEFSIDPDGFDEALHRFSRFFVDPLMKKRFVNKERNAVESEYRMKIEDRWHRWSQARAQTVNPDHPGSRFSVGNLTTLADRPGDSVMEDLWAFYDAHYTADRMHLAVLDKAPLDTLEGWVRGRFEQVPTGTGVKTPTAQPQFLDNQLGVRINIEQREDVHGLLLEWPIPEQREHWPKSPTGLLSHVLGDEGPGSLFAQLAERNWVTELVAGDSDGLGPNGDTFQLDMTLTAEGAEHTDEIVRACFAAIETLKSTPMPEHLAEETRALAELAFRFEPPEDASPLVTWVSERMVDFPVEHVLGLGLSQPVDDPTILAGLLDQLSIDRVRIIAEGKEVETDQTEPLYKVGYSIRPLTDAEKATYAADSDIAVTMPLPNPWMPESTEMRTDEVVETARSIEGEDAVLIAPDARWKTPRTTTQIDLHMSADGVEPLDQRVLAGVYGGLLQQVLIDFRYPVELAGSEYGVRTESGRFRLQVESWSDVHSALVDAVLTEVRAFEPTVEQFEAQKTEYLRNWGNMAHGRPLTLISHAPRAAAYTALGYSYIEWIEVLEGLEFGDLQAFLDGYWRPGRIRAVSFGDTTDALALEARDHLVRHAAVEETDDVHAHNTVRWYPEGVSRTHEVAVEHDDSAVWIMYLGPPGALSDARWTLLADLLSQPFYHNLRTKQQLGYVASLQGTSSLRVPGIKVQLQSTFKGPTVLLNRMDAFLQNSPERLAAMRSEDFISARDSLAEHYREPPSTFDEQWWLIRNMSIWGDTEGPYDDRTAAAIETITQADMVALARELFATDSPTRIVAWNVGRAHQDDPLKGTADCPDRACLAEGMETVFTKDFAHPVEGGVK